MPAKKMIAYHAECAGDLERVNNYLEEESKRQGFVKGGLCFTDQDDEIFAITTDYGRIELRPTDSEIIRGVESRLEALER